MSLIKRLGYYFSGFLVGLIFLMFFLSGKKTRCTYSPKARVLSNIEKKQWYFSDDFPSELQDSTLLYKANVDFSKSRIGKDSCNNYRLTKKDIIFDVVNCDSVAYFKNYSFKP